MSIKTFSYAQFIAHGYTSCMTCHYNPYGGGPLNDYGRAVGASAVSAKDLYSSSVTDEDVAKNSKFLGKKEIAKWLKPFANYRGLSVTKDFRKAEEESKWINMLGRIGVSLEFSKKLIITGSVDYAPLPDGVTEEDKYRSREHYIGYQFSKKWGLYAGLMDKVFGLRIPDHIAYSKQLTGLTMNDQSYGVIGYYRNSKWDIALNPFVGNTNLDKNLQQKGASTRLEYEFNNKLRVGASVLSSSSELANQTNMAIHLKTSLGKGSAILLELGNSSKKAKDTTISIENNNTYLFSQYHLKLRRGLYLFNTLEYFKNKNTESDSTWRFGPGLQYFPIQRLEVRAEIQNTRLMSEKRVQEDAWSFLSQVHLWF